MKYYLEKLRAAFIKSKYREKVSRAPSKSCAKKYFCECDMNKEEFKMYKKLYNLKLNEKFLKLEKERGLCYSDSMSDLSDLNLSDYDEEGKKRTHKKKKSKKKKKEPRYISEVERKAIESFIGGTNFEINEKDY